MLAKVLEQNKNKFSDVINFENKKLFKFDFSEKNKDLTSKIIKDTSKLSGYINSTLKKNNADIGYGGYMEDRAIYKKSAHFGGDNENSRTIHLGIDIWCIASKPVFSPYDGVIHSFKNNDNFGDYGPTIILEHQIEDIKFHTLYGHLSLKSLEEIEINQFIIKGKKIGEIGKVSENGNWPPHLHFQIIKDIEGKKGDYPGVCGIKEKNKYSKNCLNPQLILNI